MTEEVGMRVVITQEVGMRVVALVQGVVMMTVTMMTAQEVGTMMVAHLDVADVVVAMAQEIGEMIGEITTGEVDAADENHYFFSSLGTRVTSCPQYP